MKGSFKKGEDAVSPVIGVILMVAITVILAAVIGAFVFGMGPSESAPTVNFRAVGGTDDVVLTVMGGDSVAYDGLNITALPAGNWSSPGGDTVAGSTTTIEDCTAGTTTVTVVHTATNSVIFQADVNVG